MSKALTRHDIEQMLAQGLSQREISKRTGIPRSTLQRLLKASDRPEVLPEGVPRVADSRPLPQSLVDDGPVLLEMAAWWKQRKAAAASPVGGRGETRRYTFQTGLVDDVVPASTVAGLPPPGTVGKLRALTDGVGGLALDTGVAWLPLQSPLYRLEAFPGADFGARLNACIAVMPASGGVIDGRGFSGSHLWSTAVSTNKSIALLLGSVAFVVTAQPAALTVTGTANLSVTGVYSETLFVPGPGNQTMSIINHVADGHLQVLNLFAQAGGSTQTGGAFITVAPVTGQTGHTIVSCLAESMFHAVVIGKANAVWIHRCNFVNTRSSEILATYWGPVDFDAATTFVTECVLGSNRGTGVAIALENVGGMYVTNCHILGYGVGVRAACTEPHAFNEICLYNNRIGLQETACVVIGRTSGTGTYAQMHLVNNYFGSPEASLVTCVQLGTPGGTDDISFSSVLGNRLTAGGPSTTALLAINHGADLLIADNDFVSANPSNTAIEMSASSYTDVLIGRNKYTNFLPDLTISAPPIPGVIIEPMIKTGAVIVDPGRIPPATQTSVNVTIAGLRPAHGDRIAVERPTALHASLVLTGVAMAFNDTMRLYLYNTSGIEVNDGPTLWRYTWTDIVP